jgi:hypothetical protein
MTTKEATAARYRLFAEAMVNTGKPMESARIAGFQGTDKALAVTANRLKKHPKVQAIIAEIREELKDVPTLADKIRIDTQGKREFLWNLAHICARVDSTQDVEEEICGDGTIIRTIKVVETVFRAREAIEAIAKLNEMDGDIAPPKQPAGGGGMLSIEQLVLAVTQNNIQH